jgi:DNA polymerase-3 subunit beta
LATYALRANPAAVMPKLGAMPPNVRAAVEHWLNTAADIPDWRQPVVVAAPKPARTAKAKPVAAPVALPELSAPGMLFADAAALLAQLRPVIAVIERRATIPILEHVLIRATPDGTVTVTGTDLDMTTVAELRADAVLPPVDPGDDPTIALAVNAATLAALLKGFKHAPVVIGADGTVTSGAATVALDTREVADFPVMGALGSAGHAMPAAELADVLGSVAFAMSTEETRYYLNGVFLQSDPIGRYGERHDLPLRAVTTDGHRLAQRRFTWSGGDAGGGYRIRDGVYGWQPEVPVNAIVPRKAVHVLLKSLNAATGDAVVRFGTTGLDNPAIGVTLALPGGPVTLTSRLIDGTFPDVDRVLPAANEESDDALWSLDTKALADAVVNVLAVSTEKARAVKLTVAPGKVMLAVKSGEGHEASAEVAADTDLPGDRCPFVVGFNGRYLLDMCARAERLAFRAIDSASQAMITDPADPRRLFLLMPMRV